MEKARGLRQPSPPMKLGGRQCVNRGAVPPRGAFSAQMLRPPSTPTFSTDSPLSEHDEFHQESHDYAFVTPRRDSNEVDNQALSPPPPPPPYHSSPGLRHPLTHMKGIAQVSLKSKDSTKSKHESSRSQSSISNKDEQPRKQSTDKLTPSVHPIDTLSKKLRQQAMELTHVYEELEKQNLQVDMYKQQIQDQKQQLEKLREKRRKSIDGSSKVPTSSREQQKRAAQMMIGTPSTGASLGQKRGELDRKLKEAEREKKKYELAAKRIEKALVELQVFQNDRMEKLLPSEGQLNQSENDDTTSNDFQAVLNEQRTYIRVLEEAIHLKATDFEVTGHEELLIVLAELRHTIYEQEKDVEEKSHQLSSLQEQLDQEKQQHLATKDILSTAENYQKEMTKSFQEQESALHAQIEEIERQLQEKNLHLSQLQDASTDAQRTEETLKNCLAAATKTQNLTEDKLQDATRNIKALQEKLDGITTKYEEAKQHIASLREESTKNQFHLDELNALQEDLLGSVDKYASKVKKSRDKVERLKEELQFYKEKELLAQKQLEDAARSSDERVSALQTKVDTGEHQLHQLQEQCTTLDQEKNSLQSTLAGLQQNLQGQIEESNERQREITAKEQKCSQLEEAVAELEAALSTALVMMLDKTPDTSEQQVTVEDEEGTPDADEHAFLLNQFVLRDLEACCQALSTLVVEKGPTQWTSLCPSFSGIVTRVKAIGERVLNEVNRALGSWTRERTNLVEACAMLNSTARMCQLEMEKRYDEIRDYRQQLAERMSDVEAYVMQVNSLDEKLRSAQVECEAYHALEQHAANQEKALEAKQALIYDLSVENDRLTAVENEYSVQVATNARYSKRLEDQQQTMKEQREYVDELESALENAAVFAEQQNECNQQLNTQLVQLENSQREQSDQVKMLEVQNSTFSSRFVGLVKQYATFLRPVAATDRSLQNHLDLFDVEIQNGDALRLLQLFPALLEEYISLCTSNSKQDLSIDSRETQRRRSKATISTKKPFNHQHVEMATLKPTHDASPKTSSPLKVAATRNPVPVEKEEAQLAEQLELIRGAFQSYKDDVETDR